MTRGASLRSRVKGNFQARFWSSGGRGDSPTDCRKLSESAMAPLAWRATSCEADAVDDLPPCDQGGRTMLTMHIAEQATPTEAATDTGSPDGLAACLAQYGVAPSLIQHALATLP